MKVSKIIIILAIFSLFSGISFGQSVNYKVEKNAPKSAVLSIGVAPLDFFMINGEPMGGPGVNVFFRPIPRVKIHSSLSSALYMNDAREAEGVTGLKKLGGIFGEAHAEYVWLRKGINLTDDAGNLKKGRFNVKSVGYTTKYINFPYNRVVERSIRAGAFYNNFYMENNTKNTTGVFVGLSRTGRRYAKLNFEGYGTKEQGSAMGYYFDLMFGSVAAVDPTLETESGSGFRLGIDIQATGGLAPVLTTFEVGKMPGASGFMRVMFTFALQSGEYFYEGSYKERKAAKKTIPALIRAL